MTARRSVSVKVRFDVFNRDDFTCRYCGRMAPRVELVVDHVTPVLDGGGNNIENLATSCVECNSGKGANTVGVIDYTGIERKVANDASYRAVSNARKKGIVYSDGDVEHATEYTYHVLCVLAKHRWDMRHLLKADDADIPSELKSDLNAISLQYQADAWFGDDDDD